MTARPVIDTTRTFCNTTASFVRPTWTADDYYDKTNNEHPHDVQLAVVVSHTGYDFGVSCTGVVTAHRIIYTRSIRAHRFRLANDNIRIRVDMVWKKRNPRFDDWQKKKIHCDIKSQSGRLRLVVINFCVEGVECRQFAVQWRVRLWLIRSMRYARRVSVIYQQNVCGRGGKGWK